MNDNEITELETYFNNTGLPKEIIRLDVCTEILDCKKFIEGHITILKANIHNPKFGPYLNRLRKLKNLIQNDTN